MLTTEIVGGLSSINQPLPAAKGCHVGDHEEYKGGQVISKCDELPKTKIPCLKCSRSNVQGRA